MGLFSKLFGGNKTEVKEKVQSTPVNTTASVIDMSKSAENLNKVLIDMSKGSKIDMTKHVARVALAMDYSGSMDRLYYNGSVQNVIIRLLPIALKFDDNGELESWLFSNQEERLPAVNVNNYENYVQKVMMKARMSMGGTNYAPVLKDMVKYYKDIEPSSVPAFIIFITDGENFDKAETNKIIKELSNYNIFVQFIGIGNESFTYLKSLDNMEGRVHDNTGFTTVKDMNKMTDGELYTELLRQYKDWLNK
jgi:uncharacterized protein with von Willebrand factor type A (vWA) domain